MFKHIQYTYERVQLKVVKIKQNSFFQNKILLKIDFKMFLNNFNVT